MRKWLFILLLLPLLITGAQAAELPEDLTGAVPDGAEDVLRDAGDWDLSGAGGFTEGVSCLLDQLGEFCIQVFGTAGDEPAQSQVEAVPQLTSLLEQEQRFLSREPDQQALAGHLFYKDGL